MEEVFINVATRVSNIENKTMYYHLLLHEIVLQKEIYYLNSPTCTDLEHGATGPVGDGSW
jgi:hypothetical protein